MKGWAGVIGFLVFALVAGMCLSCAVDDDDESLYLRRDRDRCEQDCQRSGDGDRKGNRYCFMPCDFTIIVPIPGQPGPDEQASLFPPNPEKMIQAIQGGAAAIGKAAGDLAGAAAALPIAILL